jgi:uncharacterized membrane protein YhhN
LKQIKQAFSSGGISMPYFVLAVAIILVALFIFVEVRHRPVLALFLKGIASFGFIGVWMAVLATKLYLNCEDSCSLFVNALPVGFLLLAGLVTGLLGDVFLALRPLRPHAEEPHIILGGTLFFAIGHVFYYAALLLIGTFNGWAIPFSLVMTAMIYLSARWLKMDWEKNKISSLIYSFLIFLMVGQAFVNAAVTVFSPMTTLMFIGSVLFAISDLILSQIYFRGQGENKLFIIANLTTYYAAQMLIAISLLFLF